MPGPWKKENKDGMNILTPIPTSPTGPSPKGGHHASTARAGGRTSGGQRSQSAWGKGTEQGSKWHVSQMATSLRTGTMPYWPMCHNVLQKREVSSLGRLTLEASENRASTGLGRNMCRGRGWRYHPLHLSPTWGSQDLPTAICVITLCAFQSTAPHSLTQDWLSEQMLMGKSCWND